MLHELYDRLRHFRLAIRGGDPVWQEQPALRVLPFGILHAWLCYFCPAISHAAHLVRDVRAMSPPHGKLVHHGAHRRCRTFLLQTAVVDPKKRLHTMYLQRMHQLGAICHSSARIHERRCEQLGALS